jgi:hypothetical protein
MCDPTSTDLTLGFAGKRPTKCILERFLPIVGHVTKLDSGGLAVRRVPNLGLLFAVVPVRS